MKHSKTKCYNRKREKRLKCAYATSQPMPSIPRAIAFSELRPDSVERMQLDVDKPKPDHGSLWRCLPNVRRWP
ncbi:hypothetical protein M513_07295, partial [Trichuris suis]